MNPTCIKLVPALSLGALSAGGLVSSALIMLGVHATQRLTVFVEKSACRFTETHYFAPFETRGSPVRAQLYAT